MLSQLLLATFMVIVTATIHILGLAILTRVLRSHSQLMRRLRILPLTVLLIASIGIVAIHTVEIWMWAAMYLELQTLRNFEEALYFSTVTYASIGYGDVVPVTGLGRALAAILGMFGVLTIGIVAGLVLQWISPRPVDG